MVFFLLQVDEMKVFLQTILHQEENEAIKREVKDYCCFSKSGLNLSPVNGVNDVFL